LSCDDKYPFTFSNPNDHKQQLILFAGAVPANNMSWNNEEIISSEVTKSLLAD